MFFFNWDTILPAGCWWESDQPTRYKKTWQFCCSIEVFPWDNILDFFAKKSPVDWQLYPVLILWLFVIACYYRQLRRLHPFKHGKFSFRYSVYIIPGIFVLSVVCYGVAITAQWGIHLKIVALFCRKFLQNTALSRSILMSLIFGVIRHCTPFAWSNLEMTLQRTKRLTFGSTII